MKSIATLVRWVMPVNQWEAAVADAKRRFLEDYRLELLRRRVRDWEEGEAIRA